jgi:hypothetical protein
MIKLVEEYGTRRWGLIGSKLNGRTGKQCRERWHNQLDPNINKNEWTEEEEQRLLDVSHLVHTSPQALSFYISSVAYQSSS